MAIQIQTGEESDLGGLTIASGNPFTIEMRIRASADPVFSSGVAEPSGNALCRFYHGRAYINANWAVIGSGFIANKWQTVSYVSDGTNVDRYLDGALNGTGSLDISSTTIEIDRIIATNGFDIDCGEIRIFNDVRTSTEILNNYNIRMAANEPGLIKLLALDENAGTVLNDTQTNTAQVDGALGTASWITDDPFSPAAIISNQSAVNDSSSQATITFETEQTTGTIYGVIDSAANLSGVTVAQVKAGQKNDSTAAFGSGSGTVDESPETLVVAGMSFVADTEYTFAIVQNNANGDSSVYTGTFTVPGLEITSVDATLTPGSNETIAVKWAGTAQGTVTLTDSDGTSTNPTITSWPVAGDGDGNIIFTVPSTFSGNLKPGFVTVEVENSGATDSASTTSNLLVDPGFSYLRVVSQDTGADEYINSTPAPVDGDLIAWETVLRLASNDSQTAYTVTVNNVGLTWWIAEDVPEGAYYFDCYFYDQSDGTWGASHRETVVVGSGVSSPVNDIRSVIQGMVEGLVEDIIMLIGGQK